MKALVALLLLTTAASAREGSWAERHGPQFIFEWTQGQAATADKAVRKLAENPGVKKPVHRARYWMTHNGEFRGYNGLAERSARIERDIALGGFSIFYGTDAGWMVNTEKRAFPMPLETTYFTGMAVSRDRYCREDNRAAEDTDERDCAEQNAAAIELYQSSFEHLEGHHVSPGGAQQ